MVLQMHFLPCKIYEYAAEVFPFFFLQNPIPTPAHSLKWECTEYCFLYTFSTWNRFWSLKLLSRDVDGVHVFQLLLLQSAAAMDAGTLKLERNSLPRSGFFSTSLLEVADLMLQMARWHTLNHCSLDHGVWRQPEMANVLQNTGR